MAMYLLSILKKGESAPIFVKALISIRISYFFHAYMYRVFCHTFCLLLLINGLLTCLRGPQGRLVPPIGSPSVNKVYLLTYLLTYLITLKLGVALELLLQLGNHKPHHSDFCVVCKANKGTRQFNYH